MFLIYYRGMQTKRKLVVVMGCKQSLMNEIQRKTMFDFLVRFVVTSPRFSDQRALVLT